MEPGQLGLHLVLLEPLFLGDSRRTREDAADMTTRLPQEVYEELGFTHEQFEKAMAMVQELGSNRAADRAMGLSSGTVARWARAWLLASRALEENPQADPREILAGLKLSRRSVLGSLPETGNTAVMAEPD